MLTVLFKKNKFESYLHDEHAVAKQHHADLDTSAVAGLNVQKVALFFQKMQPRRHVLVPNVLPRSDSK